MLCHYLSDLHLESQDFDVSLRGGDLLVIAGDLCNASRLDPVRQDRTSMDQRGRVLRFIDRALAAYRTVVLVAGNHDHYDGVAEDTADTLRRFLPGVVVLDDEATDIGGIGVFGSTLWTDFNGGDAAALAAVRRRMGEYFFVKTREGDGTLRRFGPADALVRHQRGIAALKARLSERPEKPWIVVTHHAPSPRGANPMFMGNGLDAAYFSHLEHEIERLPMVASWVHGHTHVARTYRVGNVLVASNALGFAARGQRTPGFSVSAGFELTSAGAVPVASIAPEHGRRRRSKRRAGCDGANACGPNSDR